MESITCSTLGHLSVARFTSKDGWNVKTYYLLRLLVEERLKGILTPEVLPHGTPPPRPQYNGGTEAGRGTHLSTRFLDSTEALGTGYWPFNGR